MNKSIVCFNRPFCNQLSFYEFQGNSVKAYVVDRSDRLIDLKRDLKLSIEQRRRIYLKILKNNVNPDEYITSIELTVILNNVYGYKYKYVSQDMSRMRDNDHVYYLNGFYGYIQ